MTGLSQLLEKVHAGIVRDINELAESPIKKVVVIYAGRFQPMGKHHAATYKWAQQKFKGADVYLGTSNKVELPKSPFDFEEKKRIAGKYGIRKVVQIKNPYQATEIVSKYDPETTAAVFVVGQKDADRLKTGKFFRPWDGDPQVGYRQGAYYVIAPHISLNIPGYGEMSGTTIRQALGDESLPGAEKQKVFKGIFGFSDPAIYKLVTSKLAGIKEAVVHGRYTVRDISDFLYSNSMRRILASESRYGHAYKELGEKIIKFVYSDEFGPAPITSYTCSRIGWDADKWFNRPIGGQNYLKEGTFGHAYRELKLAGLLDRDSDYGGMVGKAVLELVRKFSKQGHSGLSAQWVRELFNRLTNYENLTPITENPKEWEDRSEISGYPLWQNRRNPAIFSENGGRTWWDVSRRELDEAYNLVITQLQYKGRIVEDRDAVPCMVCGKLFKQVQYRHLQCMHGMTMAEYVSRYPNAPLIAERYKTIGEKNPMMKPANRSAHLRSVNTPEYKAKQAAGSTGRRHTSESKKKMSDNNSMRDPLNRNKVSVAVKRSYDVNPKLRALRAEQLSKAMRSPEHRQRMYDSGRWTNSKSAFDAYRTYVRQLTNENFTRHFYEIPFAKLRGREYHLDHRVSIRYGFDNNVPPEVIAHYKNLCIVHHTINESKHVKNSMSLYELLKSTRTSTAPLDRRILLLCGGAAGHLQHPFDDNGLTFGEFEDMINRSLQGELDVSSVAEKTDGQNFMVTWKDGKLKASRNKGQLVNPIDVGQLKAMFAGRGDVEDAFVFAMEDLSDAISSLPKKDVEEFFQGGRAFMNLEIIYPATKNVIDYDRAALQFHGLNVYDEAGNPVGESLVPGSGAKLANMIKQVNKNTQKHFEIIPPVTLKQNRHLDFAAKAAGFVARLHRLRNQFHLKPSDTLGDYHLAWWQDFIMRKANRMKYAMPNDVLVNLSKRWGLFDKGYSVANMKKGIKDEGFLEWALKFDKEDHAKQMKTNIAPFEQLFLELGSEVMKNIEGFLSANPDKTIQDIRDQVAQTIKSIRKDGSIDQVNKMKAQLDRIKAIGGFKTIVPAEGMVFKFQGKLYKYTGSFAAINQLLGIIKYAR